MKLKILASLALSIFFSPIAFGAPTLRINVPPATSAMPNALELNNGDPLPVWIPPGTNGPGDIFFEVWNAGDGNLDVEVDGGFSPWLQPELGGNQSCSFDPGRTCRRVLVRFDAAGLPEGTFQGSVKVSDPNAVDSPQSVPVTIHVGGDVPDRVDLYVTPDPTSIDFIEFQTPAGIAPIVTASPSNSLKVISSGSNPFSPRAFQFVHNHRLTGTAAGANTDQQGTLTVSESTFAADNREVPVTLHITNGPIADPSSDAVSIAGVQGQPAPDGVLALSNRGEGSLSVAEVEVETESGGDWLSTEDTGSNVFLVKAQAGELEPGLYPGTVRFNTNAANSPLEVPVSFEVHAPSAPEVLFRSVVNGASFDRIQGIAPGAIVSLFGSQLAPSTEQAAELPLPVDLVSTQVKVNGVDAPLFFVSNGQINFQVPFETAAGTARVQVVRDGMEGNTVSATVFNRSIGIFRLNIQEYGVIVNGSQNNFPLPVDVGQATGLNAAPARPGDVLVLFATGLGPVAPAVGSGEAAPTDPLARSTELPSVLFGSPGPFALRTVPLFSGMTPGFAGLFQVNVEIPFESPTNPRTAVTLAFRDGTISNTVEIAVER